MKTTFTRTLFYVFLICALFPIVAQGQVWEPVGNAQGISTGSAGRKKLLFDHNDNMYVGYYDVAAGKGSVQHFDYASSSWYYLGGEPGITTGTATYNSMAVNHEGSLFFFNQAGWPSSGHEVRKFADGVWTQLDNITDGGVNFVASTITPSGVIVAANNENNGTVKRYVDGDWEQVGNTGFAGGVPFFLDMASGSDGKVYVSFNNGGLKILENSIDATSTDAWQAVGGLSPIAPAAQTEDYNSSIAIDSENNLYVAYVSPSSEGNKLNVKKFDGSEWVTLGTPNFTENRVKHVSIAIAADDIIYVAVSNFENENLLRNYVVAYDEENDSWYQAGTGFASEGQGTFNSLAVDSYGNLFLAYTDSGFGKLLVKKLNLFLVAAATIEIATEDGGPAEIAVDDGTLQLKATVLPLQASQNVVWSMVSGGTFATVSEDGLVTAIASDAVVTVKAASAENSSIYSTIDIVITNQDSDVEVDEIIIQPEGQLYPDIFAIDESLQLLVTVLPAEADQQVSWSVIAGEEVLSIDENGMVISFVEGYAIVRANHIDGVAHKDIRVNVWANGCSQGTAIDHNGIGYYITEGSQFKGADDFIVADGVRFEMSKVRLRLKTHDELVTSVTINFLEDDNGRPGRNILKTFENLVPIAQDFIVDQGMMGMIYDVELDLPEIQVFNQGRYWINPIAATEDGGTVAWATTFHSLGSSHYSSGNNHGYMPSGCDASFEITGNCITMPVIISATGYDQGWIFVGETVELSAQVSTTGSANVVWTIESGAEYISLTRAMSPTVTGMVPGIAVVRAALEENPNYYDEITITVIDPNSCYQETLSNNLENGYMFENIRLAVDITVEQGVVFMIDKVIPTTVGYSTYFKFIFSKDEDGFPGETIDNINGTIVHDWVTGINFDIPFHRYTVQLDNPIELSPGKYWMEIQCNAVAWESTTSNIIGHPGVFDQGEGWVYTSNNSEYVYSINGVCAPVLPESLEISVLGGGEPSLPADKTLQLFAQVLPAAAVQEVIWTVESGIDYISIDSNGLVTGKAIGLAIVRATSIIDESIYGEIAVLVTDPVGINDDMLSGFSYYPSPVIDILNVSSANTIIQISVFDISGKMVITQKANEAIVTIDMGMLPRGIYMVRVIEESSKVRTFKVIKQ